MQSCNVEKFWPWVYSSTRMKYIIDFANSVPSLDAPDGIEMQRLPAGQTR